MRIVGYPRDNNNLEHDGFLIEGPWAEVERILLWTKNNCSARWESNFVADYETPKFEVRYFVKFKDERDAIFFKMMWYGYCFSEVA